MMKFQPDSEVDERLRDLIDNRFAQRGRFRLLMEASNIAESKWKNFFYKKQRGTAELLDFWVSTYPEDELWLLTGKKTPNSEGFPFGTSPPISWPNQTIGDRLNWVITEWAAPKGEQLFQYLEQRSKGRISQAAWKPVILRQHEPTPEMIEFVCSHRPDFTEWVILGRVRSLMSVDPTDAESVEAWKQRYKLSFTGVLAEMAKKKGSGKAL